jgi:ketosteroid isomerase-like protein
MRAYLLAFLIAAVLFIAPAGSQPGVPQMGPQTPQGGSPRRQPGAEARAGREDGIKHLLASQVEAWNQGKLEAFMQGYWQSPDLTFFSGAAITKGWEPTLLRYRQRYQAEGKEMGKLEFQILNIDMFSREAAVVTGKWQLTMSDGKQPHGLFTLIMKQMPNGWRIIHDHTSSE